jgi:hypothetical protein
MAQKIAGVAWLTVDTTQVALRGNFTVSHSMVERSMLAGQDGVHGYQELPRVCYIEADISTVPNYDVTQLDNQTDITVVAQLANGFTWQMSNAICKAAIEQNTRDGQCKVRWEGMSCKVIGTGDPAFVKIPQVVGLD